MSTIMENENAVGGQSNAREVLQSNFVALRLSFHWWGTSKSLSSEQKCEAASVFDASGDSISAGKKLIDTKAAQWKALVSVRGAARKYYESVSLPYPESGIRLIRADQLTEICDSLILHRQALAAAVYDLELAYWDLREAARVRLGSLFNPSDYPATLEGLFSVEWEIVSVEPPAYLRSLNPRIYAEQCERVQARFSEAVAMAEQAFTEELAHLVDHLAERISGDDGKPKIFRDSAIENFREFFQRFQNLNIGSSAELESLVEQAQSVLNGVNPRGLRNSRSLRERVAGQLAVVQSSLDGLLVDRPRRNIQRGPRPEGE